MYGLDFEDLFVILGLSFAYPAINSVIIIAWGCVAIAQAGNFQAFFFFFPTVVGLACMNETLNKFQHNLRFFGHSSSGGYSRDWAEIS